MGEIQDNHNWPTIEKRNFEFKTKVTEIKNTWEGLCIRFKHAKELVNFNIGQFTLSSLGNGKKNKQSLRDLWDTINMHNGNPWDDRERGLL